VKRKICGFKGAVKKPEARGEYMICKKCLSLGIGICLGCNIYIEGLAGTFHYEHTHEDHPTSPIGKLLVTDSTSASSATSFGR
jgi:hypothetical protein